MPHGKKASVELGINGEQVSVSDHIAYFWETEEEFAEAVGFLEVGLRDKDSCVIFGHRSANSKVLSVLKSHGYDEQKLLREGRITLLEGKTSASQMLSDIAAAFEKAIERGAPLVRLLGNIGWGHKDWPEEAATLQFEAEVTAACKNFPCVVVCMYDVAQLSGRIMVRGAYETHPLTVCGNVLRENPHCVPINAYLDRLKKSSRKAS